VPPEDAPLEPAADEAPDGAAGSARAAGDGVEDGARGGGDGPAATGEALLRFAAVEDLALIVELTEDMLTAELSAALAATGDAIEGRVTLSPPTADGALDARLSAALTDLG